MPDIVDSDANADQPTVYATAEGPARHQWTDWFGGLVITLERNGDTLLRPFVDQVAGRTAENRD